MHDAPLEKHGSGHPRACVNTRHCFHEFLRSTRGGIRNVNVVVLMEHDVTTWLKDYENFGDSFGRMVRVNERFHCVRPVEGMVIELEVVVVAALCMCFTVHALLLDLSLSLSRYRCKYCMLEETS